jgi:hypothetical protein
MKRIIAALALSVFLYGCADDKVINGKTYTSYGIFNGDNKDPGIRYRAVAGNIFWGIILVETLVAPIYFFGFSLFEPVDTK